MQNYAEQLLKQPLYAKYFKNFVEQYEGGRQSGLAKTFSGADPVSQMQKEIMKREDEDIFTTKLPQKRSWDKQEDSD